jgi:hypothetical protein
MRNVFRAVTERRIGVAVLLLALLSACFSVYTQVNYAEVTACQTRINQEFLQVIQTRAGLNSENESNINNLILELFKSAGNTKAQDLAEEKAFITELDTVNGRLKSATYPDIGSC